jgi:hypothetical protein
MKIPVTTSFRATSISRAFVINAMIGALIAALIVEMRLQFRDGKSVFTGYAQTIFNVSDKLNIWQKLTATFIAGALASLLIYHLAYFIIAFGGGFLVGPRPARYF